MAFDDLIVDKLTHRDEEATSWKHDLEATMKTNIPGANAFSVAIQDENLTGYQALGSAMGIYNPHTPDSSFDPGDSELKDYYKDVGSDNTHILSGAQSNGEFMEKYNRLISQNSADIRKDSMSFGKSLLFDAVAEIASPINIFAGGAIAKLGKPLFAHGWLGSAVAGGAIAGATNAAEEALVRAQSTEDYSNVAMAGLMGTAFGGVLGGGIGKLSGQTFLGNIHGHTDMKAPYSAMKNMDDIFDEAELSKLDEVELKQKQNELTYHEKQLEKNTEGMSSHDIEAAKLEIEIQRAYLVDDIEARSPKSQIIMEDILESAEMPKEDKSAFKKRSDKLTANKENLTKQEIQIKKTQLRDEIQAKSEGGLEIRDKGWGSNWNPIKLFTNNTWGSSPMMRAQYMHIDGKVSDSYMEWMMKFDTPALPVYKNGEAYGKINATFIRDELMNVEGKNILAKEQLFGKYYEEQLEFYRGRGEEMPPKKEMMETFGTEVSSYYKLIESDYLNELAVYKKELREADDYAAKKQSIIDLVTKREPIDNSMEVVKEKANVKTMFDEYPAFEEFRSGNHEEDTIVDTLWRMAGKPKMNLDSRTWGVDDEGLPREIGGRHRLADGEVDVSRRGEGINKAKEKGSMKSTRHELIHGLFVDIFEKDKDFQSNVKSIFGNAKLNAGRQGMHMENYGWKNEHEFIAESLSDPTFRAKLSEIKYTGRKIKITGEKSSILDMVVGSMREAIANVMGKAGWNGADRSILDALDQTLGIEVDKAGLPKDAPAIVNGRMEAHDPYLLSKNEKFSDEEFAEMVAKSPEDARAYIDDAVEAELNREARGLTLKPEELFPKHDANPHVKDAVKSNIEFYREYATNAKRNGMDRKNTWDENMHSTRVWDKENIVADPEAAKMHIAQGIRMNAEYQFTFDDLMDSLSKEVTHGGDVILAIQQRNNMIAKELSGDEVYNKKDWAASTRRIAKAAKVIEREKEVMDIVLLPERSSNAMVRNMENAEKVTETASNLDGYMPAELKRRGINIDPNYGGLKPFLHTGDEKSVGVYGYKMKGKMSAQEMFGTHDREEYRANFRKEVKFTKDHNSKEAEKMAMDYFDTLTGDRQIPDDPNLWSIKASSRINKFSFLSTGGSLTKYAISEMGVPVAKLGFNNVMKEIPEAAKILKQLYTDVQNGKLDVNDPNFLDLMAMSDGYEIVMKEKSNKFMDPTMYDDTSKIDEKLTSAQNALYRYTGMEGMSELSRLVIPRAMMKRMAKHIMDGKSVDDDLARWGLTKGDTLAVRRELVALGYDGTKDFEFSKWKDQDLAHRIKRVINNSSRDIIIRHDELRVPVWMTDGNGGFVNRLTRMFMGFQIMSNERLLASGMATNKIESVVAIGTSAGILGMLQIAGELAEVQMGNKEIDKANLPWGDNQGRFFRNIGIMNAYSGWGGQFGQMLGFRDMDGGIMNKYGKTSEGITGFFGGPGGAKALNLGQSAYGVLDAYTRENATEKSKTSSLNGLIRAGKNIMPLQNMWMTSTGTNALFKGLEID